MAAKKVGDSATEQVYIIRSQHINSYGRLFGGYLEVRIDAYVEDRTGTRRSINRAYIVMVAVDQEGHAVEVPRLEIGTEAERAEWAGGEKRYELRKRRRIEGY